MIRARKIFWIAPLLLLGGCVHWPEKSAVEGPPPPRVNKTAGDCLELKTTTDTDRVALLRKVEELLSAQRYASVETLLGRHLDEAIDVLRHHDFKRPPTEAMLTLARVVDARLGHPADDGWLARLQGRSHGVERAEEVLVTAQDYARKNEWRPACDVLLKNQPALAAYPYHAVQAGLTLTESQRRLGQVEPAAQSWQQAVLVASRLHAHWPAPALWEQLAAQRPVSAPWPMPIAATFARRLPAPLPDLAKDPRFAAEALIWFHVGHARLERSEASLALTAFKHADSHGAFALWDDFLSLYQAKALLALQQTPAATSLLTTLTSRSADCPWRLPALALLGSGKFQDGHTQQALAFLREAVETSDTDFVCRADAEANFGLTLLASGDQPNGLRWLHNAQQRFAATHDRDGLRQCLENEANYFAQFNKADDANRVRREMRDLESGNVSKSFN